MLCYQPQAKIHTHLLLPSSLAPPPFPLPHPTHPHSAYPQGHTAPNARKPTMARLLFSSTRLLCVLSLTHFQGAQASARTSKTRHITPGCKPPQKLF